MDSFALTRDVEKWEFRTVSTHELYTELQLRELLGLVEDTVESFEGVFRPTEVVIRIRDGSGEKRDRALEVIDRGSLSEDLWDLVSAEDHKDDISFVTVYGETLVTIDGRDRWLPPRPGASGFDETEFYPAPLRLDIKCMSDFIGQGFIQYLIKVHSHTDIWFGDSDDAQRNRERLGEAFERVLTTLDVGKFIFADERPKQAYPELNCEELLEELWIERIFTVNIPAADDPATARFEARVDRVLVKPMVTLKTVRARVNRYLARENRYDGLDRVEVILPDGAVLRGSVMSRLRFNQCVEWESESTE